MRIPRWSWQGWLTLVAIPVAVLGVASLGWLVNDWLWKRGEIGRLNELADADSLRLVVLEDSLAIWQRRTRVARYVADHVSAEARKELERARLEARASYNLAIRYRNQLVGEQAAPAPAGQDTRIPILLADEELTIEGNVFLRDHIVPPRIRVDAELEAVLHRLGLEVTIGEALDGGLVIQVTTRSPNVQLLEVEGVTDLRSTGAERKRPGFLSGIWKGFGLGALLGAIVGAAAAGS